MNKQSIQERGKKAEEIALCYLKKQGYDFIAQRYRVQGGEIDLLMTKDTFLVLIEVRLRKTLALAAESINFRKKQNLTKTLMHFIMRQPSVLQDFPNVRFDVILIDKDARIKHIENAFGETE